MNIRNIVCKILIIISSLIIFSCSLVEIEEIYLSGEIDVSRIDGEIYGPIFLALTNTDDFDEIENNPDGTIHTIINVGTDMVEEIYRHCNYSIKLSDYGIKAGDEVSLIAFVDNDFSYLIPELNEGDIVGFYIDKEKYSAKYIIKNSNNSGVDVEVNRYVFDFDSSVAGTIEGDETGDVLLLAYGGDIDPSNFDDIDFAAIYGFSWYNKDSIRSEYSLEILPYGHDVPIDNVNVIAVLDRNQNGKVDGGDLMGIHPNTVTINEGVLPDIDIELTLELSDPSPDVIYLNGKIVAPVQYDTSDMPMFIIVIDPDSFDGLTDGDMSGVKYFVRLPDGESDRGKPQVRRLSPEIRRGKRSLLPRMPLARSRRSVRIRPVSQTTPGGHPRDLRRSSRRGRCRHAG